MTMLGCWFIPVDPTSRHVPINVRRKCSVIWNGRWLRNRFEQTSEANTKFFQPNCYFFIVCTLTLKKASGSKNKRCCFQLTVRAVGCYVFFNSFHSLRTKELKWLSGHKFSHLAWKLLWWWSCSNKLQNIELFDENVKCYTLLDEDIFRVKLNQPRWRILCLLLSLSWFQCQWK